MRISQRGGRSPGKWTIVGLLFIVAIVFTQVDANAVNLPYNLAGSKGCGGNGSINGGGAITSNGGIIGASIVGAGIVSASIIGVSGTGGIDQLSQVTVVQQWNGGQADPLTDPAVNVL